MIGRIGRYILMGKLAVPCDDLMTWGRWIEDNDRAVWQEETASYLVSTVFLGLNHNFGRGLPLLFETMVFTLHTIRRELMDRVYDIRTDVWMDRCGTWEEALVMHEHGVAHAHQLERQLPVLHSNVRNST